MKQEETKYCQSCGMPMITAEHFGTEADGTPNDDYCAYCYKEGAFAQDCTMEEMIQTCAQFHAEMKHEDGSSFTRDEAVAMMGEFFPHLKRWKK